MALVLTNNMPKKYLNSFSVFILKTNTQVQALVLR
jgi:hypothetical protein